jgi:uncharacterized protein YbcC (UPF0753/DUF2309 family)
MAWQAHLQAQFDTPVPALAQGSPALQAVFCIDVRSEVYRRALEAQSPDVQTLGFAGFFGLPIAYRPRDAAYQRPQLPALLRHGMEVTEKAGAQPVDSSAYRRAARWQALGRTAPGSFGIVESVGIGYAFKLLRDSFLPARSCHVVDTESPAELELRRDGDVLSTEETADLLAGILGAMTLTGPFAPSVLLVGHGSSTRNNPHAAGLDCGACGGQSGALNVRLLAQLLNEAALREALAGKGIDIPEATRFLPAVHDTPTDELRVLHDAGQLDAEAVEWLQAASEATRRERAAALGVSAEQARSATRRRADDWAELRPEWALAGNACFVVAPRARTRHLNFGGRSFLHDYDWEADAKGGYGVLELIMTAPMLVTNWINMQYNASVTDPLHCGSGNKLLHNVVGGNIGVFEGNGGDLRIGLPMQSVHDGERFMHEPLRLSVYIAAPAEPIAEIAARHEVVRQLIDNDWLYLFRLDEAGGPLRERLYRGEWQPVSG